MAAFGYESNGYDPAVEEYSKRPEQADIVACTDVMEHIEPEFLEAVLSDIRALTRRIAFFVVSTRAAEKTLPDGRNAHLIQMHSNLWLYKLMEKFIILKFVDAGYGFIAVCVPKR
jgi:2-polyprenyl-3-methyl-5-hydroxy-6-metoxy-1,4-benzoquinol methylase